MLTIRVSAQEEIEPELRDDELDLGIGFGDLPADDIEALPLHEERPSLIVRAGHLRMRKAGIAAKEVAQIPLVLLDASFSTRRIVDLYFRSKHLRPKVVAETNSVEALIEIVRNTDLATILPANVAGSGLVSITLQPALATRRAALLSRRASVHRYDQRSNDELQKQMTASWNTASPGHVFPLRGDFISTYVRSAFGPSFSRAGQKRPIKQTNAVR